MKNLRLTICSIIAFLSLAIQANAQQSRLADMPAEERAQMQTQRMTRTLRLDSVQAAQVAAINLLYARQMDPVISGNGSRLSKVKTYREINASKEKELEKVLSAAQFRQFKQQQQEAKAELKKHKL